MSTASESVAQSRVVARVSLERLLAGNRRFKQADTDGHHRDLPWRAGLVNGQAPIATVLACVDSRVPVEYIFDEGFGDLLVVRTAGQSLEGTACLGSLQFGVSALGLPLLMVLGHTGCGAVEAGLNPEKPAGPLGTLANEIAARIVDQSAEDPRAASIANVRATVQKLRALGFVTSDDVPAIVVGAIFDLESGIVDMVDDHGLLDG